MRYSSRITFSRNVDNSSCIAPLLSPGWNKLRMQLFNPTMTRDPEFQASLRGLVDLRCSRQQPKRVGRPLLVANERQYLDSG